jgi:hypothetical protein
MQFSIVMAIKRYTHQDGVDNLQRLIEIGLPTYEKWLHLPSVRDFFVICTKQELPSIKRDLTARAPQFPWRFIHERELVDERVPNGWAVQQTAKLAIARLVQTDHYLIVDDDTFLTRPFAYENLFHNGRLIMNRVDIDFPFFHLWSCQAIGANFDKVQRYPYQMGITPQVFVRAVVIDLMAALEARHGATWQLFLANNKFTEYCMYWAYLIMQDKTDLYASDGLAVYGGATTGKEHNLADRLKIAFDPTQAHYFSFVQSSLSGHSVESLKEAISAYLSQQNQTSL